jgi:hypothetical protein
MSANNRLSLKTDAKTYSAKFSNSAGTAIVLEQLHERETVRNTLE